MSSFYKQLEIPRDAQAQSAERSAEEAYQSELNSEDAFLRALSEADRAFNEANRSQSYASSAVQAQQFRDEAEGFAAASEASRQASEAARQAAELAVVQAGSGSGGGSGTQISIHDYGVIADGQLHAGNHQALLDAINAAYTMQADVNGQQAPVRLTGRGVLYLEKPVDFKDVSADFSDMIVYVPPGFVDNNGGTDYAFKIGNSGSTTPVGLYFKARFHGGHDIIYFSNHTSTGIQSKDFYLVDVDGLNAPNAYIELSAHHFSSLLRVWGNSEKVHYKLSGHRGYRLLHECATAADSPDVNNFLIHAAEVGIVHEQSSGTRSGDTFIEDNSVSGQISGQYYYNVERGEYMPDHYGPDGNRGSYADRPHIILRTNKAAVLGGLLRACRSRDCTLYIEDRGNTGGQFLFNNLAIFGNEKGPAANIASAEVLTGIFSVIDNKYTGEGIRLGRIGTPGCKIVSLENRHNPALVIGGTLGSPTKRETIEYSHQKDNSYGETAVKFEQGDRVTIRTNKMAGYVDFGSTTRNRIIGTRDGALVTPGTDGEVYNELAVAVPYKPAAGYDHLVYLEASADGSKVGYRPAGEDEGRMIPNYIDSDNDQLYIDRFYRITGPSEDITFLRTLVNYAGDSRERRRRMYRGNPDGKIHITTDADATEYEFYWSLSNEEYRYVNSSAPALESWFDNGAGTKPSFKLRFENSPTHAVQGNGTVYGLLPNLSLIDGATVECTFWHDGSGPSGEQCLFSGSDWSLNFNPQSGYFRLVNDATGQDEQTANLFTLPAPKGFYDVMMYVDEAQVKLVVDGTTYYLPVDMRNRVLNHLYVNDSQASKQDWFYGKMLNLVVRRSASDYVFDLRGGQGPDPWNRITGYDSASGNDGSWQGYVNATDRVQFTP